MNVAVQLLVHVLQDMPNAQYFSRTFSKDQFPSVEKSISIIGQKPNDVELHESVIQLPEKYLNRNRVFMVSQQVSNWDSPLTVVQDEKCNKFHFFVLCNTVRCVDRDASGTVPGQHVSLKTALD